jgi:hypothetical protein
MERRSAEDWIANFVAAHKEEFAACDRRHLEAVAAAEARLADAVS